MRRIFNDGDRQCVKIPHISPLLSTPGDSFDLLDVCDLEVGFLREHRAENSSLGVCVDAGACTAFGEGGKEEGCAS